MSASAFAAAPVVMLEVRDYVLCSGFVFVISRARHPISRNGAEGTRKRTYWHHDGRIETLH